MADDLLSMFREFKPVPEKIIVSQKVETSGSHQGDKLSNAVSFNTHDLAQMRQMHVKVVENLPELPFQLFSSQGIVMVGGGKFLRIVLHSIRMLRRSGTTLPVELWMADSSEYDSNFCREVLTLQVRCRVLADYVGEGVIGRYQLKSFAILLSSFAEVLYLDADNFSVRPLDHIFGAENYTITGVVIWPDYWASTVSPWLYYIINRSQRFMRTCESGQLMWNKHSHFASLTLACYYNFYGPDYFYPLLSLGAAGEGDKETFLLACDALGQPYTFIDTNIVTIGYNEVSEFHGSGMMQADPQNISRYLFIHAHYPKMDGPNLFAEGTLQNSQGDRIPSFWGVAASDMAGYDVETAAFEELAYVECNSSLATPDSVICHRIIDHVEWRLREVTGVNG
jgi:alpha 1,2-mannosyltransferase